MKKKRRILIIDGPLGGGGAERVLIDYLKNLDYSIFDVDLAVICRGGILMDEVPDEVNVIELWPGYSWDYKVACRLSKWFHCNAMLSRKMNGAKLRRDYDLEISFLEGMPLKLGALRTTSAKKATWVHADIFSNSYEASQFFKGEEQAAYNKMDVIVNVSKDCENAFLKRFPNCRGDLRVIYNPIDRSKIERMAEAFEVSKKDGFLTVITVGRLTPQKKPNRLLELAKMAHDRGLPVRFKWIGDGELRQEMERTRDEMGLQGVVEYTGFTRNPFPHIKAADIMLVTSDFEGFCLVVCEAQCLGVPVISTPTAGPCEIIGNNEYGIISGFDTESLFEHLKYLVENPEERKRIAEQALSRPDNYSISKAIKALDNLL